jgi:hypothetical protein
MRLGVHDRAERPPIDQPSHLLDGRLVAPFVADAEHDAGLAAGFDRAFRVAAREGEGLFAEDVLAGASDGEHLFRMQGVRRAQDDRVDVGIAQHIRKAGGEFQPVLGRETLVCRVGLNSGHDAQSVRIRHAPDHVLAPPAKTGDRGADHRFLRDYRWCATARRKRPRCATRPLRLNSSRTHARAASMEWVQYCPALKMSGSPSR